MAEEEEGGEGDIWRMRCYWERGRMKDKEKEVEEKLKDGCEEEAEGERNKEVWVETCVFCKDRSLI